MRIDHVTIAGPDLNRLRADLRDIGIDSEYGGVHSNGLTHMALVPFLDGSYLELISILEPHAPTAPWWDAPIRGGAGACAWAIEAEAKTLGAFVENLARRGVVVEGPRIMHRVREDGRRAEWELVILGEGPLGSTLPFLIADHTPREVRVPPPDPRSSIIEGVARVVLGVESVERTAADFARCFAAVGDARSALERLDVSWPGVELYALRGTPVVLAASRDQESWLARRIARFGELPCAFILECLEGAELELATEEVWPEGTVRWWEPDGLSGTRLGFVERSR